MTPATPLQLTLGCLAAGSAEKSPPASAGVGKLTAVARIWVGVEIRNPSYGAEEKGFVSDDRAANRPTKLVLNERCDPDREVVLQVQRSISQIVVCETMKLIVSGASDRVNDTAGVAPKLRVKIVREYPELL